MSEDVDSWQPLSPDDVREVLAGVPTPWWIAGGWAIDLFLGERTREHGDMDILILRKDRLAIQSHLSDWDLHKSQQPGLKPWPHGEYLLPPVTDIWCRYDSSSPWSMEFMLMETEGERWVYRRQPKIRGPLSALGAQTDKGLPYIHPEIQLLYKAKPETLENDEHDFDLVLPRLSRDPRQWLHDALSIQFPHGHEWIERLKAT